MFFFSFSDTRIFQIPRLSDSSSCEQSCRIDEKQIDGALEDVLPIGNLKAKLEAFDWLVLEEKEGNNIESVIKILNEAKRLIRNNKPVAIILHTEMGNGVDFMMGTHKWHGSAPNDEQLENALSQNPITLGDY